VLVFEGHGVVFADGMVIDIVVTHAGLVKEVRGAEVNVFSGVISGSRMKLYPQRVFIREEIPVSTPVHRN
jgi:hypothetical protein